MTSVQRGFLWLSLIGAILLIALGYGASALWRAGETQQSKALRYQYLAENRTNALSDLDQWRSYATTLQQGYITAASAAQAEALLREELARKISTTGAELASIQTKPAERGDADGVLRLRVVLTTAQSQLTHVLSGLTDNSPVVVVESSQIKIAGGIQRPGTTSPTTAKPLQLSLDISAFWKEPGTNG